VLLSKATREQLSDGNGVRSLGVHRLKDLQQAEEIFEITGAWSSGEFPPLRTLDALRNNLPSQATPLVGREEQLAQAQQRLLEPTTRLLTLTGPGGTGKTRLALQLAAEVVEQFADGVCFVPLASINAPDLVATAIAQALGILQAAARQLVEVLTDYLRERQLLLVLDNFEHVLPAAAMLSELLTTAPRLKVLVTSRAVLHIDGESDLAVPPLGLPAGTQLPPIDELTRYEAVRLFVERAQAVKADFAVTEQSAPAVVEICHRLDGLPLGIELAAARVRLLPPQSMLARLERRLPLLTGGARDLPLRHQTLRSAIAWSYDLLDGADQRLFRRLPVFVGGCSLASVAEVCGIDALPGVESLLDKSLLRRDSTTAGEPRLSMLETIREFALEQLEGSGEAADLSERHAQYFMELAEEAEPKLHGPEQVVWLDRLEADHDNLRAALSWSQADPNRAEIGLRIASALVWFDMVRGYFDEGRRALDAGLVHGDRVPLSVKVKALSAAGHLANLQPDFPRAIELLQESMTLAQRLGDRIAAARARALLAETARFQGDFSTATELLEASLKEQREVGDVWGSYHTLYRLGEVAREQEQFERSIELHRASLELRRQAGDNRGIAGSLYSLGFLALAQNDTHEAATSFELALQTNQQSGNKVGVAICLEGLAAVALACNEPRRAAQLLGAVAAVVELFGGTLHWGARGHYEQDCAAARAQLDEQTYLAAEAAGRAMSLDQAVEYALNRL
jgi:predicted ATPase